MARISNEVKIGITVIGAILVAFIGFRVMRDVPLFRQSNKIYATFAQVSGLNPGSYIYINGVKVGSVKEVKLTPDDSVRIAMNLDLDTPITKGSVAYLRSTDILGQKAIIIERGDSDQEVPYGGEIKGVYVEGMVETIKQKGEQLGGNISDSFDHFNELMNRLNKVINEQNRSELRKTLSHLRATSGEISRLLERNSDELDSSVKHANHILQNLDTVSTANKERVDSLMVNLQKTSDELQYLTRDMRETSGQLTNILRKINDGKGSLGLMVNDPSLYNNLDSLASQLKDLTKNINEDPHRYLKHMRLIDLF